LLNVGLASEDYSKPTLRAVVSGLQMLDWSAPSERILGTDRLRELHRQHTTLVGHYQSLQYTKV
jgi:hypothetical protein